MTDTESTETKTEELRPPLTTTTSIKPAATVLAIAIATLTTFILINVAFDSGTTTPSTVLVVGGLAVDPANDVLRACQMPEVPPADIASGLIVPTNTQPLSPVVHNPSDEGAFDCTRSLAAPYVQGQILGFYLNHLRALGWSTISQGPAPHSNAQLYIFEKAGSDTFYWNEGVSVFPTSRGRTAWSVNLYQLTSIS